MKNQFSSLFSAFAMIRVIRWMRDKVLRLAAMARGQPLLQSQAVENAWSWFQQRFSTATVPKKLDQFKTFNYISLNDLAFWSSHIAKIGEINLRSSSLSTTTTVAAASASKDPVPFKWPLVMYLAVLLGAPYLTWKLISSTAIEVEDEKKSESWMKGKPSMTSLKFGIRI